MKVEEKSKSEDSEPKKIGDQYLLSKFPAWKNICNNSLWRTPGKFVKA